MKIFLFKFLSLLIGFYLLYAVLVAFFPWKIFYREYPMWVSKEEIMTDPLEYSTFVLGDSRALSAFLPVKIADNCYNLALGGGTPIEGYYTLKRLVRSHKVKKIIVSYAPFHLESTDTFFERTIKFKFLTLTELTEIFRYSFSYNQKFWDEKSLYYKDPEEKALALIKAFLTFGNFPFYYKPELSNLSPVNRYKVNVTVYKEITASKGHFNFGTAEFSDGLSKEANRSDFVLNKVCVAFLEKTFQIARENNIQVLYKTAPCNATSFLHLNKTYVSEYNRFFSELKHKYPSVVFDETIYPESDSLFGDPSHLNKRGCIYFSEKFKGVYSQWLQ
ncbi:MAG: hypothetical protein WCI71_19530 [Bacteroidota bacterium]